MADGLSVSHSAKVKTGPANAASQAVDNSDRAGQSTRQIRAGLRKLIDDFMIERMAENDQIVDRAARKWMARVSIAM